MLARWSLDDSSQSMFFSEAENGISLFCTYFVGGLVLPFWHPGLVFCQRFGTVGHSGGLWEQHEGHVESGFDFYGFGCDFRSLFGELSGHRGIKFHYLLQACFQFTFCTDLWIEILALGLDVGCLTISGSMFCVFWRP